MLRKEEYHGIKMIIIMTILGIAGLLFAMCVAGNAGQHYADVLVGYTSVDGSNKSVELFWIYSFSIFGSLIYFAGYLYRNKLHSNVSEVRIRKDVNVSFAVAIAITISVIAGYLFRSSYNEGAVIALGLLVILFFVDKNRIRDGLILYCVLTYAQCGLYRLYVICGGNRNVSLWTIALVSCVFTVGIIITECKTGRTIVQRAVMVAQLCVPLCFLVFFSYKYQYRGEFINIRIPIRVGILIFLILFVCILEAALIIKKTWGNSDNTVGNIISYGSCVAIMIFNRYSGRGAIMPQDGHHQFEDVIGFSQIFELGQKPFESYVPVSGMYSVVHGFFISLFGHGQLGHYYVTTNLFYLVVIVLIVLLLKSQVSRPWLLFISVFFLVIDYNRVAFIVPTMLLLMIPEIVKRKNLWLKLWMLSSLFGGLYYPVFGAAICIGYFPMGVWQIVSYIREGQLKNDAKHLRFYLGWLVSLIPVIASIPLLIGILKHTLAMGGQTIYTDGLARFGQAVPVDFLSCISSYAVRLIVFDILTFMPLIIIVWVSVAMALRAGKVKVRRNRLYSDNPEGLFCIISLAIMVLVSVSYTAVRLDIDKLYSRNEGLIYTAFVLLIVSVCRYFEKERMVYWIVGMVAFFLSVNSLEGFYQIDHNSKLESCYSVSDESVYIENDNVQKLGRGFMAESIYDEIENTYENYRGLNRDIDYLGLCNFGMAYLCELKGAVTLESATICGYEAADEAKNILMKNHSSVGGMLDPISCYYLYHWLLTSGNYYWSYDDGYFRYNDNEMSREDVLENNRNLAMDYGSKGEDLMNTPDSWGQSFDDLSDVLKDVEIECSISKHDGEADIEFSAPIDGNDADYLYVEYENISDDYEYTLFSNHKERQIQNIREMLYIKGLLKKEYNYGTKVNVKWTDDNGQERYLKCNMGKGKLLIQLGGESGWLLNKHSKISMFIEEDDSKATIPQLKEVRMLKLREIN